MGIFKRKQKNDNLTSLDQRSPSINEYGVLASNSSTTMGYVEDELAEELKLEKEKNFFLQQKIKQLVEQNDVINEDLASLQYKYRSLSKESESLKFKVLEAERERDSARDQLRASSSSSRKSYSSSRLSKLSLQSAASTRMSSINSSQQQPTTSSTSSQHTIDHLKSQIAQLEQKNKSNEEYAMSKLKDFKSNENLLIEKLISLSNRDHSLIINEILGKLKDTTLSEFESTLRYNSSNTKELQEELQRESQLYENEAANNSSSDDTTTTPHSSHGYHIDSVYFYNESKLDQLMKKLQIDEL